MAHDAVFFGSPKDRVDANSVGQPMYGKPRRGLETPLHACLEQLSSLDRLQLRIPLSVAAIDAVRADAGGAIFLGIGRALGQRVRR